MTNFQKCFLFLLIIILSTMCNSTKNEIKQPEAVITKPDISSYQKEMESIFFQGFPVCKTTASKTITDQWQKQYLEHIKNIMVKVPDNIKLYITGHAKVPTVCRKDKQGKLLKKGRAEFVKNILVKNGFDGTRIIVVNTEMNKENISAVSNTTRAVTFRLDE